MSRTLPGPDKYGVTVNSLIFYGGIVLATLRASPQWAVAAFDDQPGPEGSTVTIIPEWERHRAERGYGVEPQVPTLLMPPPGTQGARCR